MKENETKMKEYKTFKDLGLSSKILEGVHAMGFEEPTPIQAKSIPKILSGNDMQGIAQTGTGKTAAFTLPMLHRLLSNRSNNPRGLVLCPTRELTRQISQHIIQLAQFTDLKLVTLHGKVAMHKQIKQIENGVDIIVSTPQRFLDVYHKMYFQTKEISFMVLDEADKLIEMGFDLQIYKILEVLTSRKRQSVLFSATMPEKVLELSMDFLSFPQKIIIEKDSMMPEIIEQCLYKVPNFKTKISLLGFILSENTDKKVIVFVSTRKRANDIYKYIHRKIQTEQTEIGVIHANKDQNTRKNTIDRFIKYKNGVLVATDVLARGIDISSVHLVINFDIPHIYEDYVHRSGRTGRVKSSGKAISFCDPSEVYFIEGIEQLIKKKIKVFNIPEGVDIYNTEKKGTKAPAQKNRFPKTKRKFRLQRSVPQKETKKINHKKYKNFYKKNIYIKLL